MRLLHGDIDTALVYGFGKSTQGNLRAILTQQLDPYYLAPLGIDQVSLAALQARAYMERSGAKEDDLRAVAARSRGGRADNPYALHLPDRADEATTSPRCARTTSRPSPTAPRRSCSRPGTGRASCASGPRGSPASTTASRRTRRARGT